MPGGSRALPDRPNLRYLRLEAKRRLAAGEFASLHDAQTAIAREHGQPSWAALKQAILNGQDEPESHALAQLRWVISRFSGADEPGWAAPGEDELRPHFSDRFLDALPPARQPPDPGHLHRRRPAARLDQPTQGVRCTSNTRPAPNCRRSSARPSRPR